MWWRQLAFLCSQTTQSPGPTIDEEQSIFLIGSRLMPFAITLSFPPSTWKGSKIEKQRGAVLESD